MNSKSALQRLEELERRAAFGAEIEDLSSVDFSVYGADALPDIYRSYGLDGLRGLLSESEFTESEKRTVSDYIRRIEGEPK